MSTKNGEKEEEKDRYIFKLFAGSLVALFVYLTYTGGLPAWLYFEHAILLFHTWAPDWCESVLVSFCFPLNALYFARKYYKNYMAVRREKKENAEHEQLKNK